MEAYVPACVMNNTYFSLRLIDLNEETSEVAHGSQFLRLVKDVGSTIVSLRLRLTKYVTEQYACSYTKLC